MKTPIKSIVLIVAGLIIGAGITTMVYRNQGDSVGMSSGDESAGSEPQPLYWVAPMDDNYRRDKPGLSPMGMDLVPVYAEDTGDAGPGAIKISPEVVNNLGVRTAAAERKALKTEIKTVGYVRYDENKLIHIHPRVEGWIEKLHVKATGDPVTAGQPLYEIYSPALVNAQEELLLALDRKNKRLIQAAEDRLQALQLPPSAIQQLRKNQRVQQTITFFAPQTGVVDDLAIREGFFVKPGTTLMSVGALDNVWVEAEVFERQASWVKTATPVTMTLDYLPGPVWRGQIDYVYPILDPKTRTVKVRMRFANDEGKLKPNMFAQVIIHTQSEADTLLIPREALIRTGTMDRVVLALGDGRFKSIEVKVGRLDGQQAEILEGLKAGESVVTSAQFLLDSESSKNSDFKRMSNPNDTTAAMPMADSVWTEATIISVMPEHRMINAKHPAIDPWGWPDMTMDFAVADNIDMTALKPGMTLHVEITKSADQQTKISNVHLPDSPMNQENHDSGAMP